MSASRTLQEQREKAASRVGKAQLRFANKAAELRARFDIEADEARKELRKAKSAASRARKKLQEAESVQAAAQSRLDAAQANYEATRERLVKELRKVCFNETTGLRGISAGLLTSEGESKAEVMQSIAEHEESLKAMVSEATA